MGIDWHHWLKSFELYECDLCHKSTEGKYYNVRVDTKLIHAKKKKIVVETMMGKIWGRICVRCYEKNQLVRKLFSNLAHFQFVDVSSCYDGHIAFFENHKKIFCPHCGIIIPIGNPIVLEDDDE